MADHLDRDEILRLLKSRWAVDQERAISSALNDPHADELLAQMLGAATYATHVTIAALLGDLHGDAGTAALRAAAGATGPHTQDLRCVALLALAKRCGRDATPWLRDALRVPNGEVREYAVIGLAGAGGDEAWDDVAVRLAKLGRAPVSRCLPSPISTSVAYLGQHVQHDDGRRRNLVALVRHVWSRRSAFDSHWFGIHWAEARPDGPPAEDVAAPDAAALRAWARESFFAPVDRY